jgi:hypothetical protein
MTFRTSLILGDDEVRASARERKGLTKPRSGLRASLWYKENVPLAEKRYEAHLAELDSREYE